MKGGDGGMQNSVIPDIHELESWLRGGLSPREASERYAERGLNVSANAIAVTRWRKGWPKMYLTHEALIPWKVAPQHVRLLHHRMLSAESRRRQGKPPTRAEDLRQLEKWLAWLRDGDAVIHYDADTPEGWWPVHRRPGVDTDLIRVPDMSNEAEVARLRPSAVHLFK